MKTETENSREEPWAISEGMFTLATSTPLTAPINAPTLRETSIAKNRFCPPDRKVIVIAPLKAAIAPTDRSKFPDMTTKVIPVAIIPIIDDCLSRFSIFVLVKKLGVAKLMIVQSIKKPIITP